MPGILLDMDASDPPASSPTPDAPNRRRSGRVISKPVLYQQDPNIATVANGSSKRKRAQRVDDEEREDGDMAEDGDESMDDDDADAEEELKPKKRKAKAKQPSRKPAAKKAKTAQSEGIQLAMRLAVNGAKKPSKPRPKKSRSKVIMQGAEGTGLYGRPIEPTNRIALTGHS